MAREYTAAEKASAVGLALSVGPVKAAEQLGIPRTTLQRWIGSPRMAPLVALNRQEMVARLAEGVSLGIEVVIAGLSDPTSRLADRARALEVLSDRWQLLSGGATSRTSTMDGGQEPPALSLTPDQLDGLAAWLEKQMAAGVPTDELVAQYAALPEPPQLTAGKEPPDVG